MRRFETAGFRAAVTEVKHLPSGDVKVALQVPYADRWGAVALADAFGLMLEVRARRRKRS